MRALAAILFFGGLLAVASLGTAQPPEGQGGKGDKNEKGGRFGKGFPGGFGCGQGGFGVPAIGQVMPVFVQNQLKLTDCAEEGTGSAPERRGYETGQASQ